MDMCNCFLKITNKISRFAKLILAAGMLIAAGGVCWGTNYRWTTSDGEIGSSNSSGGESETLGWWSSTTSGLSKNDVIYLTGESSITITLNSDVTIKDLYINSDSGATGTITINTNGHTLTCTNIYMSKDTSTDATLNITGTGAITASYIEYPSSSTNSRTYTINVDSGATLNAGTVNASTNGATVSITGSGTAKFSTVNNSGSSYSNTVPVTITWKGTTSSYASDYTNWDGISEIDDLSGKNIVINSGTTYAPDFNGDFSFKSLTINDVAATQSSGTITIAASGTFTTTGTGTFTASGGSVVLSSNAAGTFAGDVTFYDYEGTNPSPITCGGAFVIKNGGQLRGPVTAASVEVDSGLSFLGGCSAVITSGGTQIYKGECLNNYNGLVLTGSTVTFESTFDTHGSGSNNSLEIDGNAVFNGAVGSTRSLGALTVNGNMTASAAITASGAVTVSGTLQSDSSINAASVSVTGDSTVKGSVTTSGNQTYTGDFLLADAVSLKSTAGSGSIAFSGNVKKSGATAYALTAESATVTFGSTVSDVSGLTVTGNAVFNGSSVTSSGTVSVSGTTTLGNALTVTSTGNQTYTGKITSNSNSLKISTDGTATFSSGFADSAALTLTGNAEISGSNTFTSFAAEKSASITFNDANSFTNFSVDNSSLGSASTVSFAGGKTQTIDSISAKGSSGNLLTLGSSGTWNVTFSTIPKNDSFEYVIVSNSKSSSALNLYADSSTVTDSGLPSSYSTTNWFADTYYWIGKNSTSWLNASGGDWAVDSDGTTTLTSGLYPDYTNGLDNIVIAKGNSSENHILTLTADVSVKTLNVNEGKVLDLAEKTITASGLFTQNGTLKITGTTSSVTAGSKAYGSSNTIEYYGTSADAITGTGSPSATEYVNLTVDSGTTLSLNAQSITVSGTLSNEGTITVNGNGVFNITGTPDSDSGLVEYSSTTATTIPNIGFYNLKISAGTWTDTSSEGITTKNDFTISGGNFTCNGALEVSNALTVDASTYDVKFNQASGGQTSSAKTAAFSSGNIYFGNDASDAFNVTDGNLSLSGSAVFYTYGSLSATAIELGKNINIAGKTTFASPVTLTADSELANSTNEVLFSSTVDGRYALSTTGTGTVTFSGLVGNTTNLASLNIAGTTNINCASITTSGTQTYKAISLTADSELTSGGTITLGGTVSGSGKTFTLSGDTSCDAGTITVSKLINSSGKTFTLASALSLTGDFENAGTISAADSTKTMTVTGNIANSGTVTSSAAITVKGNLTNTGTVNSSSTISLTGNLTDTSGTWTSGNIIFNGTEDQTFAPNTVTTYPAVDFENTGSGKTVSVSDSVKITTVTNSASGISNITFTNGCTVTDAAVFNKTGTLTLVSDTETSTFTGGITHTTGTTIVNGTVSANDSAITFGTLSSAKGKSITLSSGSGNITLGGNVSTTTFQATSTGSININTDKITTTGIQTFVGPVVIGTDTTLLSGTSNVTFSSTVDSKTSENHSLTIGDTSNDSNAVFNGVVGSTSKLSTLFVKGTTTVNTTGISTTGNQSYTDAVSVGSQDTNFTVATVNFKNTLTGSAGNTITITGNADFDNTVSRFTDLSVSGTSNIAANITTTVNQTYTGVVSLDGNDITFTSDSGKIVKFASTVTGNFKDLTIETADAEFGNDVFSVKNLTANGAATFNKTSATQTITTTGTQTYNGNVTGNILTIKNGGLLKTADGKSLSCGTFTQNGDGENMLGGSFTATSGATWGTDLYVYGDDTTATTISASPLSLSENLIIGTNSSRTTTISNLTARNIALYSGNLIFATDTTSSSDVVLLGSSYAVIDTVTGLENAYIYEQTRYSGNDSGISNSYSLESTFQDGTSIPSKAGTLSVSSGTLTCGQNFYANGLSISGNIKIKDDSDSTSSFAEAYNCSVTDSVVSCSTADKTAQIACEDCTFSGTTTNWNQTPLIIEEAYTVRDDCVYIKFNRELRNKHGELNKAISEVFFTLSGGTYTGIYSDADCQNAITAGTEVSEFYLKANTTWKTDATGTSAGSSSSTNRTGDSSCTAIPYVDIVRDIASHNWIITDIYGKRLDNYSTRTATSGISYGSSGDTSHSADYDTATHVVEDHTGPVLYSVRTGQELHTAYDSSVGESSQPYYDSHNFIEFRYSEPVNFGDSSGKSASDNSNVYDNTDLTSKIWLPSEAATVTNSLPDPVNVRVNDSFGALKSSLSATENLSIAGLGKIEKGLMNTGSNGSSNKYVNSLYRTDAYSIRLSLAGYVDDSNPVSDADGYSYNNWIGYIDEAETPSGTVTFISDTNSLVTDCAVDSDGTTRLFNPQIEYEANNVEPKVNYIYNAATETAYSNSGVYGDWDVSKPVFAPYNAKTTWNLGKYYEAIGTNEGTGSTLARIEFHLFDNTPSYAADENPVWYFEKGWIDSTITNSITLYDEDFSYAADIAGGSRPWSDSTSIRTSGGLRFCSYINSTDAFKYCHSGNTPTTSFYSDVSKVYQGTVSPIFVSSSGTSNSTNDPDSLYFGLTMTELNLSVDTTFTVSYTADSSQGFITDLAGNRLNSATINTLDRTPPSFNVTLSPVNQKELYISFVKKLQTNSSDVRLLNNDDTEVSISEDFLSLLPQCFELISIDSTGTASKASDISIDTSIPAQMVEATSSDEFTGIKLTLTNDITLNDIENLYIRVTQPSKYSGNSFKDHLTNIQDSYVTLIQDEVGNYMKIGTAHALSDFAINVINPLYAYDEDFNNDSSDMMLGIYEDGSWAVHDFNADQQNYGTLPANHPIAIVTSSEDGTDDSSQVPEKARIYLSPSPDADSVSTQYNDDFETDLRIWLPKIDYLKNNRTYQNTFSSISTTANETFQTCDSSLLTENKPSDGLIFNIPLTTTSTWTSGNQISFLFSLQDDDNNPVTIYSSPYLNADGSTYDLSSSIPYPLFALRLTDSTDITSIDLWSIRLKSITDQRGGITILNNVINSTNGEKTVIKVNMAEEGTLNLVVMTLDGNVVQYLQKGTISAGEHYYSWNGKTKNGKPAARGMYFIRAFGKNIDETRKVMVVK